MREDVFLPHLVVAVAGRLLFGCGADLLSLDHCVSDAPDSASTDSGI